MQIVLVIHMFEIDTYYALEWTCQQLTTTFLDLLTLHQNVN